MNHLKYLLNSKLEKTLKSAPHIVENLSLDWLPIDIKHHVSFAVNNKKALTFGIFVLVKVDNSQSTHSTRLKPLKKQMGVALSNDAKRTIRSISKTMQDPDISRAFYKLADK